MKGQAFFPQKWKHTSISILCWYVNKTFRIFHQNCLHSGRGRLRGEWTTGGKREKGRREAVEADEELQQLQYQPSDPTRAGWSEPILARSSCVSFGSSLCCASYRKEWILIPWDRSKDLDETTSKEPEGLSLLAETVVISKNLNNGKKTSWARARGGRYSVHLP